MQIIFMFSPTNLEGYFRPLTLNTSQPNNQSNYLNQAVKSKQNKL